MSVIINDFEVVVETPEPPQSGRTEAPEAPSPKSTLAPIDLDDVLERRAQRDARVRAH